MNERGPEIVLPAGYEHTSGLYVPSEFQPVLSVPVPPELQPRPGLLVVGRGPSFLDQVYT
jgi:hypothetical protein